MPAYPSGGARVEASVQTEEGHEHGPFHEGAAELARMGMCLRMHMGADVFLDEVSTASGMSSANYLARTFRQFEGMSPREYRKKW